MRLAMVVILLSALFIMGCVTGQHEVNTGSTSVVSDSSIQQLKISISKLEAELKRLQEENSTLRQQLEQTGRIEVRMPSGAEIQTALKHAGFYTGAIDGNIGTQTKEAIKEFQQANNLNPDGAVGSRTWEKLKGHL